MLPKNKQRSTKLIIIFVLMALLGPLFSLLGFYYLAQFPVQDIAPQIRMENHWLPPLGGILGFLVGMIGFMLEG